MAEQPGEQPQSQASVWAAMVRSSHDAMTAFDTDFEIIGWNPAAERLHGYRAQEILGRPGDVLIPEDRRSDQREMLRLVAEGIRLERFRTDLVHRDGHLVPVSMTVSPLTDGGGRTVGVVTIARRVSDRERLEGGLRALLEAAPDAVLGVAEDGRVTLSNTQAEALFGLARHGLTGRALTELVSPPPWAEGAAGPATDGVGAEQPPPTLAHRADGTTVPVEVSDSVIDTEQGTMRCVVIRDISERLRTQSEYLRLRADADRARMEAHLQRTRRLESLGQLAGGVAHDFNNIIAVIVNYAGFIAEEANAAGLSEMAHDAAQITRAGQRGAELTHQLLAFARREVVRPRVLDLNDVVREVEQMLRRAIGEHITLTVRLADDQAKVTADPGQVEQVLVNLAVNARDAMPRGGHLTIETCATDVDDDYASSRPHLKIGRYVRLRVSDTGTGMPKDVIDRACEPFFTTKPAGEGTGLGLATVYGIVTAAGGDLSIYSEPGMGTTMNILLPATDQQPTTVGETAGAPVASGGETILVVEDEPALRQVVRRILAAGGYHVLLADSGPAALTLAERHDGPIHLLLTDVVMPQMIGRDLAERLAVTRPDTGVLYMSGYAQPVLASQGTLDPDVTLLEKPFTKPQLLTAVRDSLDRSAPPQ